MDSMNDNLTDLIVLADFSSETDFKDVLRNRLFKSNTSKKTGILQFQRLAEAELNMVSAAGNKHMILQQEKAVLNGQKD